MLVVSFCVLLGAFCRCSSTDYCKCSVCRLRSVICHRGVFNIIFPVLLLIRKNILFISVHILQMRKYRFCLLLDRKKKHQFGNSIHFISVLSRTGIISRKRITQTFDGLQKVQQTNCIEVSHTLHFGLYAEAACKKVPNVENCPMHCHQLVSTEVECHWKLYKRTGRLMLS